MSTQTINNATGNGRGTRKGRTRRPLTGIGRVLRRLEHERRSWTRRTPGDDRPVPTEVAWRAGVAEGLRLAQTAIRKGV